VEDERRRTPRYPFIATVEVIRKGAQAGITGRIAELSLYGCFIEMPDPFAKGSELTLKVYADGKYFETEGVAVYANMGKGAGIRFQNVRPHYLGVLKQWLIEAALAKYGKKN
jgi:PilZ domain